MPAFPLSRPPTDRDLLFLTTPCLWPHWPVLPLVRTLPDASLDLGVLVDLWRLAGVPGYSATVFRANQFSLPKKVARILALPKEVFDTADEVLAAGWRVD